MRTLLCVLCLALSAALSSGCGGVGCTAVAVAAVNVIVIDDATGQRICDATVTVKDGSFSETLMSLGPAGDCSYSGAYERAGTYEVTAQKSGFQGGAQQGVVVTKDICHVQPAEVTLRLRLS